MLSANRIKRKKIALAMTRPVSFSCVYFTCMKNRTTRIALKVAIVRATIVFKGPRSMKATPAVRPVPTSRASQMATEEPREDTCSGESCCAEFRAGRATSVMASPVAVDQVEQREKIDPDNIDEVPVQSGILNRRVITGTIPAAPRHVGQEREQADP